MAGSKSFGRLMQLGHVVPNLEDAIQYWLDRGVGPFYEMTHVRLAKQVYRGAPTDIDMGVALSYSGSLQIELIVEHNDAPSLYKDFLVEHPEGGLHHLAFITETMDEAIADAARVLRTDREGESVLGRRGTTPARRSVNALREWSRAGRRPARSCAPPPPPRTSSARKRGLTPFWKG